MVNGDDSIKKSFQSLVAEVLDNFHLNELRLDFLAGLLKFLREFDLRLLEFLLLLAECRHVFTVLLLDANLVGNVIANEDNLGRFAVHVVNHSVSALEPAFLASLHNPLVAAFKRNAIDDVLPNELEVLEVGRCKEVEYCTFLKFFGSVK